MDNILGLLVLRDSIPDNLKQQLLFIASLLPVYLVQLSVYVTLSITRPVLDCLYIVYTQIKPDVYSTLVATLPSTCEDLFFLILHILDVTATTLWSWPQVPSQDEPVSMMSAIKLAYKTVRGHSISSGDARKLYLWLPETMSRRLTSRECYHRSLSHVSGIPMFKLPFVVDVLLSKRNPGQSLDYVLARLPNAVSSLVHDEICEEIYSRHATALATIVVSLGFIFFIFSLFKLRNYIFSVVTNGLVSLRHYALFPIRFLVNRYQIAQQTADVPGSSEAQTQTEEAQPELGSVSAVQSVQTEEIIPTDDEEKSPEQRSQDSTCPTDSIQDESSAEDVILAEGSPTIAHSEEAGCVEEPSLTINDAKNTPETETAEEPRPAPSDLQKIQVYTEERSTPSDLQKIQVYTSTTPSRPPKISSKRVSSSLEHHGPANMFVPRMPSQWNGLTRQWPQNNVHAFNFNSTSTQLAQRGAMLGLRGNQRQMATPDSFFLAGTSSSTPQYFNPYGVSPGLHAYTTLQQQSLPNGSSNAYVEPTRRNIIYDSNISLAQRNQEQHSPSGSSTRRNDERDAVESVTKTAPSQPSASNESEPDGLKQNAAVVEVHPPPSNTIITVQPSTATEPSAETGPVSGVAGQLFEDEIFVYPGDANANTLPTLQAAPEAEFSTQYSTQDELAKPEVDNGNNVMPVSTVGNSHPSPVIRDQVLPTFENTEFTFNVSELSRASSVPADSNGGVWSSMHAPTRTLTPETASSQLTGLAASMHAPESHARALGDASHGSETSGLARNTSDGLQASIHYPDDPNLLDNSTRKSMHAPDPEDQLLEEAYRQMKAPKSKPGKNKKKKRH